MMGGQGSRPRDTKTNKSKPKRSRTDPFADMFGRMGGFGGGSLFDDDAFFGGDMFSRAHTMGTGGTMGTSTSTTTTIKNGKRVTVTKKTTIGSDGQSKTEVIESVDDGSGRVKEKRYITAPQATNVRNKIRR